MKYLNGSSFSIAGACIKPCKNRGDRCYICLKYSEYEPITTEEEPVKREE